MNISDIKFIEYNGKLYAYTKDVSLFIGYVRGDQLIKRIKEQHKANKWNDVKLEYIDSKYLKEVGFDANLGSTSAMNGGLHFISHGDLINVSKYYKGTKYYDKLIEFIRFFSEKVTNRPINKISKSKLIELINSHVDRVNKQIIGLVNKADALGVKLDYKLISVNEIDTNKVRAYTLSMISKETGIPANVIGWIVATMGIKNDKYSVKVGNTTYYTNDAYEIIKDTLNKLKSYQDNS